MSEEKALLYEQFGRVVKLTINRPAKRNALNHAVMQGLHDAFDKIAEDDSVSVVVIGGKGEKAFTAGFDLKESIGSPIVDVPERRENSLMELNNWRAIWECKKPVICAVQGYCIGGGVWMAMLSDLIIAADNAQFGEPELKYSYANDVLPEPWKMTMNRVKQFLYLGDFWSAEQMKEAGVVNFVVPAAELEEKTMELANKLADMPAQAMQILKYEINQTYELMGMHQAQKFAAEMFNLCRIHQVQEQAEFNKIVNEQGLKAAMAWKDAQGK